MDITLGPWTAAKTIDAKQGKLLADAMGAQALDSAKKKGFTPTENAGATPATSGFTITGQVMQVMKQGTGTVVKLMFTLWADGTFSNVAPLPGQATADGSMGAKDAVEAITEAKINQLLDALASGRAGKAH